MNELEAVLLIRAAVLFLGAIITWLGGKKAMNMQRKIPRSQISKFLSIMTYSVVLLGLVMFLIATGNLLVYYLGGDWTYYFLVSAGLTGIAAVALFIYGFFDMSRYVVVE